MPDFAFNPVSCLKKLQKIAIISIAPLIMLVNSFFEILTLILLYANDGLQTKNFIVFLTFASILLLIALVLFLYLPTKIENLYPFHNVFFAFFLVVLFTENESVAMVIDVKNFNYFLGFLSGILQFITILKSSPIIGLVSYILTTLLYFFYFVKSSESALVFVYFFLLSLYVFLVRFDLELSSAPEKKTQKEDHNPEHEIYDEVLEKVLKFLLPGNFFLLSFTNNKQNENDRTGFKETASELMNNSLVDTSPMKFLEKSAKLVYKNLGCENYGLNSKREFLNFLENFEISKISREENVKNQEKGAKSDLISKASTQRPLLNHKFMDTSSPNKELLKEQDDKESEFIHQENQQRNLLLLLKNRLEISFLNSESDETLMITGYIQTQNGKSSIKLSFSQFRLRSNGFLFFHFIELNPDEDLTNLKEVSRLKDLMLANVAHDLRSPISGIIAFIDQSLDPSLSKPEREKLLDYAKINANLLLNLVGDILDFSQLKRGCLNLVVKTFNLKDFVEQIFSLMRYQAELKKIRLFLDYQPEGDIMIQSDDRRLSQVLINLLSNAIKFTLKGSVCLRISNTRYQNVLKFEVIDNGIGIRPELKPLLFKPFATFSDKSLHNKYGIGLGLSICKTIVSLLGPGEELFVASDYGKGAKFGFLLFTKIQKLDNSSLRLNKTKVIWGESDMKIKKKGEASLGLGQIPKIRDSEEDIKSQEFIWENRSYLDMNEKVDVAPYFSESLDNIFPNSAREKDSKKDSLELGKIELEETVDQKKGNMKKVFSLNNLNESKIRLDDLRENCLNILMVDDNPFNIFILKNYLKKFNLNNLAFNVLSAANGSQACEIFEEFNKPDKKDKNQQIHVIFMDCQMPILSGYQATTIIKEKIQKQGYAKTLVVAITAFCNEENCLECGMDAYLLKPVSEKDFLEIFEIFFC